MRPLSVWCAPAQPVRIAGRAKRFLRTGLPMAARDRLDPDTSMWDWIASDLHFYRTKEGLSCAQLGRYLGLSRGAVSNLEAARPRHRLQEHHARRLDERWGLNGHFMRLLRYARRGHDPNWFREHLHLEAAAQELRIFEPMLVPGLFQTEAYARSLFASSGAQGDVLESGVQMRMSRQSILSAQDAPWVLAMIDEQVLRRPVGGRTVMRQQLTKLLDLSKLPNVTMQVIPVSTGWYPGVEGAFKIMRVDETEYVYTDAVGGGRLAGGKADVRPYSVRFDLIRARAWPVDMSLRVIKRAMETM